MSLPPLGIQSNELAETRLALGDFDFISAAETASSGEPNLDAWTTNGSDAIGDDPFAGFADFLNGGHADELRLSGQLGEPGGPAHHHAAAADFFTTTGSDNDPSMGTVDAAFDFFGGGVRGVDDLPMCMMTLPPIDDGAATTGALLSHTTAPPPAAAPAVLTTTPSQPQKAPVAGSSTTCSTSHEEEGEHTLRSAAAGGRYFTADRADEGAPPFILTPVARRASIGEGATVSHAQTTPPASFLRQAATPSCAITPCHSSSRLVAADLPGASPSASSLPVDFSSPHVPTVPRAIASSAMAPPSPRLPAGYGPPLGRTGDGTAAGHPSEAANDPAAAIVGLHLGPMTSAIAIEPPNSTTSSSHIPISGPPPPPVRPSVSGGFTPQKPAASSPSALTVTSPAAAAAGRIPGIGDAMTALKTCTHTMRGVMNGSSSGPLEAATSFGTDSPQNGALGVSGLPFVVSAQDLQRRSVQQTATLQDISAAVAIQSTALVALMAPSKELCDVLGVADNTPTAEALQLARDHLCTLLRDLRVDVFPT